MTKAETTVERVGGYRVVRRLATGGTSDVLLAKAEGPHGFERTVVLKLLLSQFRDDDDFARMFAREASAYARLSHPAIVQLFDFFAVPEAPPGTPPHQGGRGGQLCMVLEHVDGPPLTRLRTMLKAVGKELDDRAAIFVATRIFDALAAAHGAVDEAGLAAPVIHRDVNPSNVLVPWDGQVKLADFGVAKVTGLNHQSVAGMIKGTYGYMAPEQVTGDPVTPRADVYAAGLVLWELLTKRRAFQRGALPEVEALRAMAEPRLASLDTIRPDVDRRVRDALKRALEPRADRRLITAEEMVTVLSTVVPSEEGRERLVSALAIVRSSSQAAMSAASTPAATAPAPPPTATATIQGVAPPPASSGRGMLPRPASPPRPPSVPRVKAPEPPKVSGRTQVPQPTMKGPPPAEPPKVPSRPGAPPATKLQGAPASDAPRRPSASARLAVAVPDPPKPAPASPSTSTVSIFDSLVQPPEPVNGDGERPSDLRLGTPLQALTPGLALKDAIDEILRGQPSSMPPAVLQSDRARETTPGEPPADLVDAAKQASSGTLVMPETPRAIGQIPAAPPPMQVSPPPDFGATVREMVDRAEAPTVVPPADHAPSTSRMAPVQPSGQTLAMEPRPAGQKPDGDAAPAGASSTTATGRMPQYVPPAAYRTPPPAPPNTPASVPALPSAPLPSSVSDLGRQHVREPGSDASPKRRRSSVQAIVAVLVLGIVAGVAGVVAYVRYQKAQTVVTRRATSASATASAAPSIAASASVSPSVSAVSSIAAIAASASVAPSASAAPTASAAPPTSASAAKGPSPQIGEGMGIVKTTGAAPGRRIFVDEKTLGQTPESVTVKCGQHSVRLGSAGRPQTIDVPCRGEVTVGDKF